LRDVHIVEKFWHLVLLSRQFTEGRTFPDGSQVYAIEVGVCRRRKRMIMRNAKLAAAVLAVLAALPASAQTGGAVSPPVVTPPAGDANSPIQSTSQKNQQTLQQERQENAQAMKRLQTLDQRDKQKMQKQEDAVTRSAIPGNGLDQQ
jgi:hypothetical protein